MLTNLGIEATETGINMLIATSIEQEDFNFFDLTYSTPYDESYKWLIDNLVWVCSAFCMWAEREGLSDEETVLALSQFGRNLVSSQVLNDVRVSEIAHSLDLPLEHVQFTLIGVALNRIKRDQFNAMMEVNPLNLELRQCLDDWRGEPVLEGVESGEIERAMLAIKPAA